jgi:hypothetical protein
VSDVTASAEKVVADNKEILDRLAEHDAVPQAWRDLIEGLMLLSKGSVNPDSPLHCEHDKLWVCVLPESFTEDELAKLDALGFIPHEDAFVSYRFGSA